MRTKPFNYEEYLKGAKAVSRDGKKVKEILKFTNETTHQLVVLFEDGWLIRVHEDGSALNSDEISNKDILLIVEPIKTYVNIYSNTKEVWVGTGAFNSEIEAKSQNETSVFNKFYIKTIEINDEP